MQDIEKIQRSPGQYAVNPGFFPLRDAGDYQHFAKL
jgi:hypothetical protein